MSEPSKSIMRSLGEFVGHIARGVMADPRPSSARRQVVREQTQEREGTTPDGRRVILRRTVIDEIETREEDTPHEDGRPT